MSKIRRQVTKFTIMNMNIANTIRNSLITDGFDLDIKPVFQNGTGYPAGEEFTVFEVEEPSIPEASKY